MTLIALIAATAGGLVVYLYFTARPRPLDYPVEVAAGRYRLQQVAGYGKSRARLLLAFASLAACFLFLAGALAG